MRILAAVLPLLAQCHAKKPWIWTEETPTYADAPNPRLPSHGFGARIVVLDDLDHDGVADLAISAPLEKGGPESGCVFVVSGLDGHLLRQIDNPDAGERFGTSLHVCADVDQDGYADLVVGTGDGCTCVISPRSGKALRKFRGRSSLVTMDIDGDGAPDYIAGALLDCDGGRHDHRGFVAAVSGCDDREFYRVHGDAAIDLGNGGFRTDGFGQSLCVLGDLDGDSVPDFAAGAPGFLREGNDVGCVRFFSGRTGALLHLAIGPLAPSAFCAGSLLVRAGDLDRDGFDDVLVASDYDHPVFALSGRTGQVLITIRHTLSDGYLDGFGDSIAMAGDLDADGTPDIAVGCSEFLLDHDDEYSVEIHSGRDGQFLLGLDSGRKHVVVGESQDFDRDGVQDLPVGLPETDEVVILSGLGLQSKLAGPVIARSEWPALRVLRRQDLVK